MRAVLCCYILPALLWGSDLSAAPLRVVVSIPPLKYFVERIAGPSATVAVMAGPGSNPATYQPTPRQVAALAHADLYVRIGVPFEGAWMDQIRIAYPGLRILDARQGVELLHLPDAEHLLGATAAPDHPHEVGAPDPHIWMDPLRVTQIAAELRVVLRDLDPDNGAQIDSNYQTFVAELTDLDRQIRAILLGVRQREFMIFHPALGYFADRYGLEQLAVELEGKAPGPRTLAALIELARSRRIKVVLVDRAFDPAPARVIATALGARLVTIDPLSSAYVESLLDISRAIASQQAG